MNERARDEAQFILYDCEQLLVKAHRYSRALESRGPSIRRWARRVLRSMLAWDQLEALERRANVYRNHPLYLEIADRLFALGEMAVALS